MKKVVKRIVYTLIVLLTILVLAILFFWKNEIASIMSVKEIMPNNIAHNDGHVYEFEVKGDYYIDEFIKQGGVKSDKELINFVTNNITKGVIDVPIKEEKISCSSFTVKSDKGQGLFARNYDMDMTNTAIVHTNPGNGKYKSISTVDFKFLGIDAKKGISSTNDKLKILASPYVPLDGMNEKGLCVGVYMTYQGPEKGKGIATDQNTNKPDITSTTLLRLFLDNCKSVDEAIKIAEKYDMHESASTSFHYMVADNEGNSAILEWIGSKDSLDTDGSKRELKITRKAVQKPNQICTNFVVKEGYYDKKDKKYGLDRYQLIEKKLNSNKGFVKDEEEAMSILKSVGRRSWVNEDKNTITTHSVVYNMDEKSVYWVGNEHFGEKKYIYRYNIH